MTHLHVLTKIRPAKAQQELPFEKQALQWFNFSLDFAILFLRALGPKVS
ncbi:MAG TPA: hypothetical protein PLD73_03580 [Candidatus Hydrogenedentes bacterium]|jgi:hypothetical protein|nr:hypothetical protein [Candidatus Hydrogenedentota bacterium]HPJ99873.1 hypothetical protein [Candidatus Hydrogenedentota bacterium]